MACRRSLLDETQVAFEAFVHKGQELLSTANTGAPAEAFASFLQRAQAELQTLLPQLASVQAEVPQQQEDARAASSPGQHFRELHRNYLLGVRPRAMAECHYTAIGHLESVFAELNGCPRQGALAPHTRAVLNLRADLDPRNALRGIEQYSHLWLLFVFSRNTNKGYSPVVSPPKLGHGKKMGVFATRSPHRPNNIGITLVELERVGGKSDDNDDTQRQKQGRRPWGPLTLHLRGVDLVDGTPILDVKPYIPATDCISDPVRVPGWVAGGGHAEVAPFREVRWSEAALASLGRCVHSGRLRFYGRVDAELGDAQKAVEEVLRLDVRTRHMREKHSGEGGAAPTYGVCFDVLNVVFSVEGDAAVVTAVEDLSEPHAEPTSAVAEAEPPSKKTKHN
eukprot:TRINITY_DN3267_c0_g1_i1.p1 TRINITY_DN3267_c0_g1~~TRINITY_DN3267_c0_g1_i1.p1  ORF type:complete len:394 (-),score=97.55 TRINITY_DN3267_c0_g1_i1:1079-2260(-)